MNSSVNLTVVCVLASTPKGVFNNAHVERLRYMVARHLQQPYNFVCLTDSPYPGYWAKISLFEPGRFHGRVLYFDLDVTILDNIEPLVDSGGELVIMKDPFRMGFNSSVMSWTPSKHTETLFNDFDYDRDAPRFRGGDQAWIFHKAPWAHLFPRYWLQSFKQAVINGGFIPGMRVCVYHGFPKPWELEKYV